MTATRTGFELQSDGNPQNSETALRSPATYQFQYDQTTTPPSMAVVTALSEVMGVDPISLDPLQETIDPDALNALASGGDSAERVVHTTWTQEGYTVTIHNHGVITVESEDEDRTEATEK
ncbi:HalOD1 output domain-containing protein [Halobellus sp. GM3]|uniref:HalOD1 output domain-containing protein n=1 Tax=Halobellus sp. GM3 TaxID=3458410 RepID=UPI00403D8482